MSEAETVTAVLPPRPLLSSRAEQRLGERHRTVLDELEELFLAEGFASFTMRELAARLRCSMRTLYEIAPSKQDLVLVVLDRFLHRVGRTALAAIDPGAAIVERIRVYFRSGVELLRWTATLAEDAADEPAVLRLLDRHIAYLTAVLEGLIAEGIADDEFRPVDPRLAATVLAGAAVALTRPEAALPGDRPTEEAIDEVTSIVLDGLAARP